MARLGAGFPGGGVLPVFEHFDEDAEGNGKVRVGRFVHSLPQLHAFGEADRREEVVLGAFTNGVVEFLGAAGGG